MKTFREFVEKAYNIETIEEDAASYARRQKNKIARGRSGKTPKYVERTRTTVTSGRVEKTPEGKYRVTPRKVETHTDKILNPKSSPGRFKQNPVNPPSIQGGGHGGSGFGYGPHLHGSGGRFRGKKKKEQTSVPETPLNKYQRRREVSRARNLRTGEGRVSYSSMGGDRAIEAQRQAAKKSFGKWSQNVSNS